MSVRLNTKVWTEPQTKSQHDKEGLLIWSRSSYIPYIICEFFLSQIKFNIIIINITTIMIISISKTQ